MPRLPRKTTVDHAVCASRADQGVPKPVQACHPVTICATPATQSGDGSHVSLRHARLNREAQGAPPSHHKCHACHAEVNDGRSCRGVTRDLRRAQAQARHPVPSVPRLPRKTTVDVSLCHACHVKRRWMSPSATPATQSGAAPQASRPPKPGPRAPPSTISATPATQNDGRSCHGVTRYQGGPKPVRARHPVP